MMRSVTVIILLAFVEQAHSEELPAHHKSAAQDSTDTVLQKLVDELVNRAFETQSFHRADLDHDGADVDYTTFGKPGQLALPGSSKSGPMTFAKPVQLLRPQQYSPMSLGVTHMSKGSQSMHTIYHPPKEYRSNSKVFGVPARTNAAQAIRTAMLEKNSEKLTDTRDMLDSRTPALSVQESLNTYSPDIKKQMSALGIEAADVYHNAPAAVLYEQALKHEKGSHITSAGALSVVSGKKTGRSPNDKRTVDEPSSSSDIWWGNVNIKLNQSTFMMNRELAVNFLNAQQRLFIVDGFAGWDEEYRMPIRVITTRAYHALFMQNMLVKPKPEELDQFTDPFIIYNAGESSAIKGMPGMTSPTSVGLNLQSGEMVILGTQYAGEMKKGVFTVMMYHMPLMPSRDLPLTERALPLHSSANVGQSGDVSMFFGLSGTGKTTLSADPNRYLIGDDEHVWTAKGVFNIEGGCYAKCIGLSKEKEPEIFDAIKFGSVLENVILDDEDRVVDYGDGSLTENTRCAYPLEYIPNALIPATIDTHPTNIIFLTADAFGILPPVSKLTPEQAMYYFISGYTAKVAGTEDGVNEPQATFSACFGAPFLMMHPYMYAEMLVAKMQKHKTNVWLVNTGWVAGGYGEGERCPLKYTRQIVDSIHDGTLGALGDDDWVTMDNFGLLMPKNQVKDVPVEVLHPKVAWESKQRGDEYQEQVTKLAGLFQDNFKSYQDQAPEDVVAAGPQ